MISKEQLAKTYSANFMLIQRFTDGLEDPDSFYQPHPNINCLNWVLGHIIEARNRALEYLDVEPVWDQREREFYITGSDPVTESSQALSLAQLLAALMDTSEKIKTTLESVSEAFMENAVDTSRGKVPRWQQISGLGWHETYHTGQLELLRQFIMDHKDQKPG